jgi:hypothetical protein
VIRTRESRNFRSATRTVAHSSAISFNAEEHLPTPMPIDWDALTKMCVWALPQKTWHPNHQSYPVSKSEESAQVMVQNQLLAIHVTTNDANFAIDSSFSILRPLPPSHSRLLIGCQPFLKMERRLTAKIQLHSLTMICFRTRRIFAQECPPRTSNSPQGENLPPADLRRTHSQRPPKARCGE